MQPCLRVWLASTSRSVPSSSRSARGKKRSADDDVAKEADEPKAQKTQKDTKSKAKKDAEGDEKGDLGTGQGQIKKHPRFGQTMSFHLVLFVANRHHLVLFVAEGFGSYLPYAALP